MSPRREAQEKDKSSTAEILISQDDLAENTIVVIFIGCDTNSDLPDGSEMVFDTQFTCKWSFKRVSDEDPDIPLSIGQSSPF